MDRALTPTKQVETRKSKGSSRSSSGGAAVRSVDGSTKRVQGLSSQPRAEKRPRNTSSIDEEDEAPNQLDTRWALHKGFRMDFPPKSRASRPVESRVAVESISSESKDYGGQYNREEGCSSTRSSPGRDDNQISTSTVCRPDQDGFVQPDVLRKHVSFMDSMRGPSSLIPQRLPNLPFGNSFRSPHLRMPMNERIISQPQFLPMPSFRDDQETLTAEQEQQWVESVNKRCRVEKGTLILKTENLIPPIREKGVKLPAWQVRTVSPAFVNKLKEEMSRSHDSIVLPFVLWILPEDCPAKEYFDSSRLDEYRYIVLGGNHSACAKADLHQSCPKNQIYSYAQAWVYAGLTLKEARTIAFKHNVGNEFRQKMHNIDSVRFIHYRFEEAGYNSTHELRIEICQELGWKGSDGKLNTNNYNDFWLLAMREPPVWDSIRMIMDKWELGQIKGQRKPIEVKKGKSKPHDIKQYYKPVGDMPLMYWRNLQGLFGRDDINLSVLRRVLEGDLSLKEMDEELMLKKWILRVETAFCTVLAKDTFQEVKDAFPEHTDANQIRGLADDFKAAGWRVGQRKGAKTQKEVNTSTLPPAFISWIRSAKNWLEMKNQADRTQERLVCSDFNKLDENPLKYLCIEGDATKLHSCILRRPYTLAIADIPSYPMKDREGNMMEPWDEKELNEMCESFTLMTTAPVWKIVIFHSLSQRNAVLNVLEKQCSGGVEECVWVKPNVQPSSDLNKLANCFEMFTIGFHSDKGTKIPSHFNFNSDEEKVNVVTFNPVQKKLRHSGDNQVVNPHQQPRALLHWVVSNFSFDKDWVLDLCSGSGTGLCSALALGRNCVAVEIDHRQASILPSRISSPVPNSRNWR